MEHVAASKNEYQPVQSLLVGYCWCGLHISPGQYVISRPGCRSAAGVIIFCCRHCYCAVERLELSSEQLSPERRARKLWLYLLCIADYEIKDLKMKSEST